MLGDVTLQKDLQEELSDPVFAYGAVFGVIDVIRLLGFALKLCIETPCLP